jgi:hypothetical protein
MRVWRGWTTEANAQAFELFLCEVNFQAIAGCRSRVRRRRLRECSCPKQAHAMLRRFETRSRHYEVRSAGCHL